MEVQKCVESLEIEAGLCFMHADRDTRFSVYVSVVFSLGQQSFIYFFLYLLQLGCCPVAVVILHVNKT